MTEIDVGWWPALTTYLSYAILMAFGYVRDFFYTKFTPSATPPGLAPLNSDFEDFYKRRMYYRIRDNFNRPISSCPGASIEVMERVSRDNNFTFQFTGNTIPCTNLGSYNYLGFADPTSPCIPEVLKTVDSFPVSTCSPRTDVGTTSLHVETEKLVARYVGKEAAMIFGMGFGTNSTGIPTLIGKGGLIISDSLNHASIVIGARSSGAKIQVFKHGDVNDLEAVIRQAIVEGQPRSHRPWTKILIMVEGIYSMEGEICRLEKIVEIKKRYNCYLYVDEAHSIGAMGRTGRGVCEYRGVNPEDVDILMGTFTKSFGAVGGYIAGSRELIDYMRETCAGSAYSASISPACCRQIISSMKIISGEDGTDIGQKKLMAIRENSNYFRKALMDMGAHVLGDWDSPVVPIMLCNPAKLSAFSREALKRNLAVVVVGFPATPLLLGRVRFCISAGHTKEQLRDAIKKLEEVCKVVHVRYKKTFTG
eukprot:TRINITY_DN9563_c0_g1_i1.p1 TRINITY_DN9563_c0_g1~~TRINITY_DN9563_c0_g1_i1.p1  ORF type:complete len:501 (-),score=113.30 TRINITY_DN9563_c0_g1_i1:66-1499(-)